MCVYVCVCVCVCVCVFVCVCVCVYTYMCVYIRFGCALNSLTKKRIFQAYILPHVLFCLPVWGNLNISQRHLLDNCLLHFARLIMRNPKAFFNTGTYNFTGILPFQSYVLFRNAIAVFNILNWNEVDFYLQANLFSNICRCITRGKLKAENF